MRRLGPYELIQPLGAGGMAEVWMGRRVAIGGASKTVAVKLMSASIAKNSEFRRLFISEARLSMLLNNSNIVQVFDVGEEEGECYMVMEWVDGLNLAQLCERLAVDGERLSSGLSVYIVAEVLRGLAYAHGLVHEGVRTEVVHRDVSPQNVMLSVSGEVKLMDFGIARLSTEDTSGVHIKGKLRYMPPEQLRGDARRPAVDLFAVGAMFHELLEGRRFRSQVVDEARLYGMILDGEIPPLELPGGHTLACELEELRSGLLAAKEADRIPSAKEALRLLYRWPGYRNCAMDIEALVQRVLGTEAPRTSLPPTISGNAPTASQNAITVGGEVPTSAARMSRSSTPDLEPTYQAEQEIGHATHIAVDNLRFNAPTARTRAVVAATLVILGLGIGLAGVSVGLGWWDIPRPVAAEAQSAQTRVAEPPPIPGELLSAPAATAANEPTGGRAATEATDSSPELEPATANAANRTLADESTAAQTADGEPTDKPTPQTKSKEKSTLVDVELVANDYYYVEVLIAGRVYKLSPIAKARIRDGTHAIHLRQKSSDDWGRAGKITLEPGKAHRVEMLDPPGARVSVP